MAALTLNRLYYEKKIMTNPYLNIIEYDDNSLYIMQNNQIVKQAGFFSHDDLANLPKNAYDINDPYYFLEVLDINNECERNYNGAAEEEIDDLTKTVQIDRMYLPIRFIIVKEISSEEDDQTIMNFLTMYNRLINASDYLTPSSTAMLRKMASVLRWATEPAQNKPNNNAQVIIKEYINSVNSKTNDDFINSFNGNNGGMEKGSTRVRNNPNAPSVINDDLNMEKAGFFSFLALLYIAFNLLITLVIIAIKK